MGCFVLVADVACGGGSEMDFMGGFTLCDTPAYKPLGTQEREVRFLEVTPNHVWPQNFRFGATHI